MKKKVLMAMGIVLMCGLVGCGSKESVEKEVSTNKQVEKEDSVDSDTKNPYKEVKMSENRLINATSNMQVPEEWIPSMSYDFCYTDKGKLFMFTKDGASSFRIETCKTLEEMPNACLEDMVNILSTSKSGYSAGAEISIIEQAVITINDKEMLKVKGNVKDEDEGLEHNMIAYFTFHEPCQEKTEPYPVYFAYFYPDGTDEEEMEAYAYASAESLELKE